jgi:hypothetical protein
VRLIRRILLVVGVALGVTMSMVSPASADSSACTTYCSGYAWFASYGEVLHVEDRAADGHSAVAQYYRYDNKNSGNVWNPNGAWTEVTRNFDMAEGVGIDYRVCLGEYGSRTILYWSCSAWKHDHA